MQSQSNEFCPQATKRLFLAVVNQAISDVLKNGKEAKEAERWLLSMPWTDYSQVLLSKWNRYHEREISEAPNSDCRGKSGSLPERKVIMDVESRFRKNNRPRWSSRAPRTDTTNTAKQDARAATGSPNRTVLQGASFRVAGQLRTTE